MALSQEDKIHLKNKHIGGVNNQKGNDFENIYSTKEIIRLFATHPTCKGISIAAQIKDAFVDDFLIIEPNGTRIYHQIKNTENLSWGNPQKGNLLYDFQRQQEISIENKEAFGLKIVYSNPQCAIHTTDCPSVLCNTTKKEFFPHQTILSLIRDPSFAEYLLAIMDIPPEDNTNDHKFNFTEFILSQWTALKCNETVSLSEIRDHFMNKYNRIPGFKSDLSMVGPIVCETDAPPTLRFRISFPSSLPASLKTLFDKFDGFTYSVHGNKLYWHYKRMNGITTIDENLIESLSGHTFESPFDLIQLLN